MSYVRRLISERRNGEAVVRLYEVGTPKWHEQAWDVDVRFPKLVTLELRLSRACAEYFHDVPLSLAETVWTTGLRSACPTPFCCCWEYPVLYYPREPRVELVTELKPNHDGPVVLMVTLSDEGTPGPGR